MSQNVANSTHLREIRLHLGVHKTATSHIQAILRTNSDQLEDAGIRVLVPRDMRPNWMPHFRRYRHHRDMTSSLTWLPGGRTITSVGLSVHRRRAARRLDEMIGPATRCILSEENFLGLPSDLPRSSALYDHAGSRLQALRDVLPGAQIRVFLGLRSYETFYASMYSEYMRKQGFVPFATFFDPARRREDSWIPVIETIRGVMTDAPIVLWRFEDFPVLKRPILAQISGLDDPLRRRKRGSRRASLSHPAVEALARMAPARDVLEARKRVRAVAKEFSVKDGHPPFRAFDPDTAAQLAARYADDLATITERFPDVTVLRP